MALLPKDINSETRSAFEEIAAIASAAGQIIVDEAAISLHQRERDLFRLIGSQAFDWWIDIHRFEFAPIFHLKWMANGEIEIGDTAVGLEHRRQNFVQIWNSHS